MLEELKKQCKQCRAMPRMIEQYAELEERQISALRVEREKERQYFRDENRELQNQLRDTAEAVQAGGELLARLKEAEDIAAAGCDKWKKKHEEINSLNHLLDEPRLPKDTSEPVYDNTEAGDDRWREEFAPFYSTKRGSTRI
ncbi:Kinesin motor domain containing protein, expressed [Datura stramonium]|uniref:Kinesin motor domain containing protein, expressed n=1 Tax=Datura stramonium TaxID=4076 RepID=A0ABS8V4E7_DATST|nr:Kinesin motor domain containing protein, expressed [Datura stramonium]